MWILPAELESSVFSFLSIADLKSARQVNKRWAYISTPFLFEELWITQATLQILENVSCHETLRYYVKTIVIYILPVPVITPTAWKDSTHLRSLHMSPEALAFKFQQCKFLYDEQQRFASSDLGIATMSEAVDKLPQLVCLETLGLPPPAQRMQYFLPPLGSREFSNDLQIYKYVQGSISIEDVRDAIKLMDNTLIGFFETRSAQKIKHFSPGTIHSPSITRPTQSLRRLALPEYLQAMEVHIPFFGTIDEHMSGLHDALSKTLYLEKLVLGIGPRRSHACRDSLKAFRPSLPKLEHLEICGGHTTEHSLTSLLTQYTGSLRNLRLDMVSFIDQPPGQRPTSWLQMLLVFLSEEGSLARVTLTDLSYSRLNSWNNTWMTPQCLLSIQSTVSHKAALLNNEAYEDNRCAHRQSSITYSDPIYEYVLPSCWGILRQLRRELRDETN